MGGSALGSLAVNPITAGLMLYSVKRAAGDEATVSDIWSCYDRILPITGLVVLQTLLTALGFIFLVFPGCYGLFAGVAAADEPGPV